MEKRMLKMRIIRSGFRTAWTHKVRSFFMVLSVMVGIAALTVIISLGRGTEQKITAQVQKFLSSNTIMIISGGGKLEPNRPVSVTAKLKLTDIEEIVQLIPNIIDWDAVQRVPDKEAQAGGNATRVDISGHTPSAENVMNLEITSGRFFSDAENLSLARVAVLAPHVRQKLFGVLDPIGQMIKIDNIPFQIIGVIGRRGMDPHGIDKDNEVLVPLNTVMRRVVNLDYIQFAKILIGDEKQMHFISEQITHSLREKHSLNQNEADDFMVITPIKAKEIINQALRIFNVYLPLLAVVSLIVGGIVIVNLMLLSVNERVKEIGLRKAVGARSTDIAMQFLIEASAITILSGVAGMIAGSFIFMYVARMMDIPPVISWPALVMCSAASVVMGIAAGYLPAKKAARLSPIESLR
jgi:putative ABC transport system permease protein